MGEIQRVKRLTATGGVLIAGIALGLAFYYLQPFDSYLLKSWEEELSTLADQDVEVRLEQIAAVGERSLPTLVSALHSERRIVAQTAAAVLHRKLGDLEPLSAAESSRIVASLARELAAHSSRPGPYSDPTANQLATRFLLWPIDRKLIDGEQLVTDCELIIRSAKRSPRDVVAKQVDEEADALAGSVSSRDAIEVAEMLTPVAGGGLPVPRVDAPPFAPQTTYRLTESPVAPSSEQQQFVPVQASRSLDSFPAFTADEAATRASTQPFTIDSQNDTGLGREAAAAPTTRGDLRAMADLDVMRKLASHDESQSREAVDELYRRGFKTKQVRLAESLADPDPNIRLQLIQRLPQLSGIDSRPWLLWLSRDQDPAVRKAAVAVIATSADPSLMQRVRELELEETDDEVLRVVRQILNIRQSNTFR